MDGSPLPRALDDAAVWRRYRDNTARHVMGVGRDVEHRVMHHLTDACGYQGLRPSLAPLIGLVAARPRSPSELAERLSISAQACGQLIDVAQAGTFVERRRDPDDGRARRVQLTPHGHQLTRDAVGRIEAIQATERARIGAPRFDAFADATAALHAAWTADVPAAFETRSPCALAMLPMLSVRAQRTLMETTGAAGHDGLKMSHAQVLPLLGANGARVGTLARVQGISRQAVSATARDLERLGYVERAATPGDGRGVAIRLSDAGRALIRDSVRALDALDGEIRRAIGGHHAEAFAAGAKALYGALDLEREIFDPVVDAEHGAASLESLAARLQRRLAPADRERLAAMLTAPTAP